MHTPFFDLSPGKIVAERFRIVDAHRQGGLSTAFEVTETASGERLELQLFPADLFEDGEQSEEFTSFLMSWTEVESGHVARVREIVQVAPRVLALVTEYPEGGTLRSSLKQRARLEAPDVLRLGRQILSGLAAIHGRGLVHGDIKPSTLHVNGEGADMHAVLVDGGVTPALWTAKDLGDKTALIGTPYYAPIEQFGGDAPNESSDLYNLATVMFESLTGSLPWHGQSFLEVFQAKLDKTPPSMAERAPEVKVDPDVEGVIVRGCLADRKERYESAAEFLEAVVRLES